MKKSPFDRLLECSARRDLWCRRQLVSSFPGGCRQLPRGRQDRARRSHRAPPKGLGAKAGKNWVHGGSHQAAGGGDPQKNKVSGVNPRDGRKRWEKTVFLFALLIYFTGKYYYRWWGFTANVLLPVQVIGKFLESAGFSISDIRMKKSVFNVKRAAETKSVTSTHSQVLAPHSSAPEGGGTPFRRTLTYLDFCFSVWLDLCRYCCLNIWAKRWPSL